MSFVCTFSPPPLEVDGQAWASTLSVAWASTLSVAWAKVMRHGDVFLVFLVAVDGTMHSFGFLASHMQICVLEGRSCGSCAVNLASVLFALECLAGISGVDRGDGLLCVASTRIPCDVLCVLLVLS